MNDPFVVYRLLEETSQKMLLQTDEYISDSDYENATILLLKTNELRIQMAEIQFEFGDYSMGERDWLEGAECLILSNVTAQKIKKTFLPT